MKPLESQKNGIYPPTIYSGFLTFVIVMIAPFYYIFHEMLHMLTISTIESVPGGVY
ncbi:hypothetical protein C1645_829316 [Glomus cerebriforme]|uniref:Uncharacterized protein n=1 Tax=Glomus cerebriforme TaxID=658196 RepID=A0A397SU44_9GLOM|nr:hypothetical protein C1645_829316 [Glomus cerebriforme]